MIVLLAAGYLGILVVVLAMLAAAGRADRAAGRDTGEEEQHAGADERPAAADAERRFRRRRAARELAQTGRRGPDD
jgi:hypothetical protein